MLCSLYRWFVSRSIDLDKPIPAFLLRHRYRCPSCQEYSDFCTALKPKASRDFKCLLEKSSIDPPKKLEHQTQKITASSRKKTFLIPFLSAAASVLVIFILLVWLTFSPVKNRDFPEIRLISFSPEKAALSFEDPYEKEYIELKRTMKSTADFLAACLDIKIGDSIE